jgi:hypothetical protein
MSLKRLVPSESWNEQEMARNGHLQTDDCNIGRRILSSTRLIDFENCPVGKMLPYRKDQPEAFYFKEAAQTLRVDLRGRRSQVESSSFKHLSISLAVARQAERAMDDSTMGEGHITSVVSYIKCCTDTTRAAAIDQFEFQGLTNARYDFRPVPRHARK